MNVHEVADDVEGWFRSRKEQAPVESDPSELDRFTEPDPRDVHPDVDAGTLSLGPTELEASVWRRLPPSHVPRVERPFEFASPVESPHEANDVVTGLRWHGQGGETASTAVVMLHGAFAPSFAAERLISVPLLRRNAHVFAMAAPYHMGRAPPTSEYSGQYLLSGDVPRFVEGVVQAVADVRRLVATLQQEGYDEVYLSGVSLGGNVAAQALTMADVDGGVLTVPAVDFAETLQRAPIAAGMRRAANQAGFSDPDVRRAMAPITPERLGSPVPDESDVHVVYGRWDRQVPAETVESLLGEWPGASSVEYPTGHRTTALRILAHRHQLAGWLDAKMAAGSVE
ncbi:alpha/beta fold hydrolase [Halomicrococcus gelatinilyticus]|uniref:alpha/beta fold hydrolase n=1 Tax=Halomicrococcus gelatinilyticus TaxID=1702103 RepID=UPI002E1390C6